MIDGVSRRWRMLGGILAVVLLWCGDASAAKHKKKKDAGLQVGDTCDMTKEIKTNGGALKVLPVGAVIKITDASGDSFGVSLSAGTAKVKKKDLKENCKAKAPGSEPPPSEAP